MKACKMKLSELQMPERNVRIHTEQQIREFEKSVKMFGQLRPLVVDENNTILAGNGLFVTLKKMGYEKADVYKFDDLTENQKKKLMIADNRIFTLGIENLETLNAFLEELSGDLEIPGFDEDVLRQMTADAEQVTQEIATYGTLDSEEVQRIKENAARKAAKEETGSEPSQEDAGQDTAQAQRNDEDHPANAAETGRYVICPKCGAQIWL